MKEHDFLVELEQRAHEQERMMQQMPFRTVFVMTSLWFGRHPWRIMIPFAFVLTFLFRLLFGHSYDELILWIFGGI